MTWWQLNSEMFWIGPLVWSFGYTSQKTAKTTQNTQPETGRTDGNTKFLWKQNWGLTVPSDVWISCNPVVKSLWPYKLGSVFLRLAPLTSLDMSIAQPNGSDSEARINEVSGFPLKKNLEFVVVVEWCIQKCGWPGQLGTLKMAIVNSLQFHRWTVKVQWWKKLQCGIVDLRNIEQDKSIVNVPDD